MSFRGTTFFSQALEPCDTRADNGCKPAHSADKPLKEATPGRPVAAADPAGPFSVTVPLSEGAAAYSSLSTSFIVFIITYHTDLIPRRQYKTRPDAHAIAMPTGTRESAHPGREIAARHGKYPNFIAPHAASGTGSSGWPHDFVCPASYGIMST